MKIETDVKSNACNLVIPKVSSTHLGKFKIVATNSVGSIEHSFDLNVLGKLFSIHVSKFFSILFYLSLY